MPGASGKEGTAEAAREFETRNGGAGRLIFCGEAEERRRKNNTAVIPAFQATIKSTGPPASAKNGVFKGFLGTGVLKAGTTVS